MRQHNSNPESVVHKMCERLTQNKKKTENWFSNETKLEFIRIILVVAGRAVGRSFTLIDTEKTFSKNK